MRDSTTVIIPNYNGMQFLETCLDSLGRQTYRNFRILVVDNGSTDGSAAWLKEQESDRLSVICLPENTGFAAAVNTGIRASKTRYVLLLNNDVRADERFVEELVRAIGKSKRIFSAASKMIRMYEPDRMDSAGDLYTCVGWAFNRGTGEPVKAYDQPCDVFSACAGAAIYRREAFDRIGLFDERHFAYLEDIDVGYRARIFGFRNVYAPRAVVWHVGSGTSGSKYNAFKVRLTARNNVWLNYKNMPAPQLALNALPIACGILVKGIFFQKMGFGKEYRQGLAEGLRTRRDCEKVPFRASALPRYARIEGELILNFARYIAQQLRKRR
ncbi:MAG: glycosyltransferase family 2 protein [Eubacterium sp.]|nr:glycosyltransferase family 2 protein [Eubacterium sp.]